MMRVSIGRALLLLALVVGASVGAATAAHAAAPATAPPLAQVTTPVSGMPQFGVGAQSGQGAGAPISLIGVDSAVVLSCEPKITRQAWRVPIAVTTTDLGQHVGTGAVPPPNVEVIGWPVEVVAYSGGKPVARTGCVNGDNTMFGVWGSPSEHVPPADIPVPPAGTALAILPGQAITAVPATPLTPAPTSEQSRQAPQPGDEGGAASTASHPHGRNATPAYLAAAVTLLLAAWSRRRVRADLAGVEAQRTMVAQLAGQAHGALGAGVDALDALSAYLTPVMAGLAVAFWPGLVAYPVACAMAVLAASTLAARYACSRGIHLRASDVLSAARQLPREPRAMLWPGVAAAAAAALGELSGWGLALCAWAGVGALLLAAGVRSVAVRQRAAADRAALGNRVAAVLGVSPARLAEVRWTVGADSAISIATPPETMLRLADLPGRVSQAMPDYEVSIADSHQVVLSPASADTQQARATHAATGGLVTDTGGAPTAGMPYAAGDSEAPLVINESDLRDE